MSDKTDEFKKEVSSWIKKYALEKNTNIIQQALQTWL